MQLYPLKFKTIYKDKIWGGEKIKTVLGKDFSPLPNCGETWEISGVKGNISEVAEGEFKGHNLIELIDKFKGQLVGEKVYAQFGNEFPLLIKFIDANDDLSIQVHPNDVMAKERHNSFGKTEMWYIFEADKGAELNTGFKSKIDSATYVKHLNNNTLDEILNFETVAVDDVFFLPAGRVHYIGKGICLAEIQQTSDITYRIYDFDRKDDKGNLRELHTDLALDAIDYNWYPDYKTVYEKKKNEVTNLITCQYFQTNRIHFDTNSKRDYSHLDSFVIYVCVDGSFKLKTKNYNLIVKKGDSILLPAEIKQVELIPIGTAKLLEAWVP
ncbi:MAG: type I phosphomannose isomerase catalytic subunit [Cytophagales bacterium]